MKSHLFLRQAAGNPHVVNSNTSREMSTNHTQPYFALTHEPIDIGAVLALVQSDSSGAINVFVGSVRSATQGRTVTHLEYEAYSPMAISAVQDIAMQARTQWASIEGIALHHRLGHVAVGEIAVVLALSSAHRAEIFSATDWIIHTMKTTVPIWKKEVYADGAVWVSAHA
jgi:molybdopterin synthase catalytic subunit